MRLHLLSRSLLVLAFAFSRPASAQTGALLTERASTGPAGRLVLESSVDYMLDEPNFETAQPRDRGEGPRLRLVYSAADNVELDAEWAALVWTPHDPDFGPAWDYGDITLRSKVRLSQGAGRRPTWAARFSVTLPQTSFGKGLGPNTLRMSAQGVASLDLGRGFGLHANTGLGLRDEVFRAHQQRDFVEYGIAGEWQARPAMAFLTEVVGGAGDGMPGAETRSELRMGARLGRGRVVADVALRLGLADADGTVGFTAGMAWTIRPQRPASAN